MGKPVVIIATMVLLLGLQLSKAGAETDSSGPQADGSGVGRPVADKWALIIGIGKFADASINLQYPAKDARDFYDYLVGAGNFATDHVRLVTDGEATRERILAELGDRWLPRVAQPDDLVVIYFSGHGSPSKMDVEGINYLVAHDTKKDSLYATGIPMQELSRIVKDRVHSDRVVMILDACHSGATRSESKGLMRQANFDADQLARETGNLIICSSEPTQVSWESSAYPNSVFTRRLIDGLMVNGAGTTVADAFSYLRDTVRTEVLRERGELQVPVLKCRWNPAQLALSVPPTKPRAALKEEAVSVASTQPPAASTKSMAAEADPAGAHLANRVLVMNVVGPVNVESKASLGYQLRTGGASEPDSGSLSGLGSTLKKNLVGKLKASLGERVVTAADVPDGGGGDLAFTDMARRAGAKLLLLTTIDEVYFEGNTLSGDQYELTYSARILSGVTGQTIWTARKQTMGRRIWTAKGKDPADEFARTLIADLADRLAKRVSQAMNAL